MKKYYVSKQENYGLRELLKVSEENISIEYDSRNMVYVKPENIRNIVEYGWKADDEWIGENLKDFLFLSIECVPEKILKFIQEEREGLKDYNESWLAEEYGKLTEEEIKKFYKQMEDESIEGKSLPKEKVWYYWTGSNHRRYVLESDLIDSDYEDYTEEFEGMKEVDENRYNTGITTLYRLKDGTQILINNSFWQGSTWEVYFLKNTYETVEEAEEAEIIERCY